MKKLLKISLGLLIVLAILLFVTYQSGTEGDLKIYFFDVGQGDGILIRTPSHQNIVIDGGPDNAFITKLGQTLPFYDKTIDLMILTHPHDDHLFGLVEVLKRYQVKQILYSGVLHSTDAYEEWLGLIKEKEIPVKIALAGQEFVFAEVKLKVIFPFEDFTNVKVDNLNNTSVVVQLIYNDIKVLFTGDLEEEGEEEILRSSIFDLQSNVIKVGHHGSNTSSSENFLQQVLPEYAIIQVGEGNKFGHPSLRTLFKLERYSAKIFRNDLNGDILLESDGQEILSRTTKP
ncbi:MBL fold metallo-hydrolase [Patescibacteria group bacterium]|nr:MBL fold metallo-hydrolase [Patescibacteria group bacterium]